MGTVFSSDNDNDLPENVDITNIVTKEATITSISDDGNHIEIDTEPQIYSQSAFTSTKGMKLLKTHPQYDELVEKLIHHRTYKFTYKYSIFGDNVLVRILDSTKYEFSGMVKGFTNVPNNFYYQSYYKVIIGGEWKPVTLIHQNKMNDLKLDQTYKFVCDNAYGHSYYKVVEYTKID